MNPFEKIVRDLAIKKCKEREIDFGFVGIEGNKLIIEVIGKEYDIKSIYNYILNFLKEYYNGSN